MMLKAGLILLLLWIIGLFSLDVGVAFHLLLLVSLLLIYLGVAMSRAEDFGETRMQKRHSREKS